MIKVTPSVSAVIPALGRTQNVMNGLLDFIAKASSLYRSGHFFCRKVVGDHIPGEGVGVAVIFASQYCFSVHQT